MLPQLLFDKTSAVLNQGLKGTALRQKVITNNIVNVDTPGFKRAEVHFEEELKRALGRGRLPGLVSHPRHIPLGQINSKRLEPTISVDDDSNLRVDENNVNIHQETADMAQNTSRYISFAELLRRNYKILEIAISERV